MRKAKHYSGAEVETFGERQSTSEKQWTEYALK